METTGKKLLVGGAVLGLLALVLLRVVGRGGDDPQPVQDVDGHNRDRQPSAPGADHDENAKADGGDTGGPERGTADGIDRVSTGDEADDDESEPSGIDAVASDVGDRRLDDLDIVDYLAIAAAALKAAREEYRDRTA